MNDNPLREPVHDFQSPMTPDMWEILDGFIEKLPEKVRLVVWASEQNSCTEGDAVDLGRTLAERYDNVDFRNRPRKPGYPYYPVVGVMGVDERSKDIDYGIRFIGLPAWYHINSLVGAMQAVAFKGMGTEGLTRLQLSRMPEDKEVRLEIFTTPENEAGVLMATLSAHLAAASPQIRTWIVMLNDFPDFAKKRSIYQVPHTIINGRYHLDGIHDEMSLLKHIAQALRNQP